jgi:hypothetical protein
MSIVIDGVKLPAGRNSTRVLFLIRVAVLIAVGAASAPAQADNGSLYVAPGPTTVITPDMIRRNQDQSQGTARRLGDLIGSSLKSPTSHATDLVVTTQCGHYKSAIITFADGSVRTLNLSNAPANQKDMDQAKAAILILRIVDIAGCDG